MSETEGKKVPSTRSELKNQRNRVVTMACEVNEVPGKRLWYFLWLRRGKPQKRYSCEDQSHSFSFKLLKKVRLPMPKKSQTDEA
tara:strand:+ start:64 stop:315 length:252 start_codon:yes stop_codon:yes gene_type:complete